MTPEPPVTQEEIENAPLKAKIRAGEEVFKRAVEEYGAENITVVYDGDVRSSVSLWIVSRACERDDLEQPEVSIKSGEDAEKVVEQLGFEVTEEEAEYRVRASGSFSSGREFYNHKEEGLETDPLPQFDAEEVLEAFWLHLVPDVTDFEFDEIPEPEEVESEEVPLESVYFGEGSWETEEKGSEEAGEVSDDEDIKSKLRDLGYM